MLVTCFFVIILLYIVIRSTLLIVTVDGESMHPTFISGDRVVIFRFNYIRFLKRGQVVIAKVKSDGSQGDGLIVIKRVTGLPGETIATSSGRGLGKKRFAKYVAAETSSCIWHIPRRYCFIQSDSQGGGVDSTVYGPIPISDVIGVVVGRI